MAVTRIDIDEFISMASKNLVLDVRSPKEYHHAHYPGALSVPLFSDEERKEVGTTYKQKSREQAIKIGLDYFGPKMRSVVSRVEKELSKRGSRSAIVHCWRGGMRSGAVAWLLDLYGFQVYRLDGGYKKFRNWALAQFEKPYQLQILGGYTGSGKTEILHEFESRHQAVVDLEGLAGHRGSAFGNLNNIPQPSTEQFENELALKLYHISQRYENPLTWVESESSRVGNVNVPFRFFNQMKVASRINIEVPFEKRLAFIIQSYGHYDIDRMIAATRRIKKRLGGLNMQQTIAYLQENDLQNAFSILLNYYDKAYDKSRKKFRGGSRSVNAVDTDPQRNADHILKQIEH